LHVAQGTVNTINPLINRIAIVRLQRSKHMLCSDESMAGKKKRVTDEPNLDTSKPFVLYSKHERVGPLAAQMAPSARPKAAKKRKRKKKKRQRTFAAPS
jgi:hypothetical protein